jgi:hypothetical protein
MCPSRLRVGPLDSSVVDHRCRSLELVFQGSSELCFCLLIFATYWESTDLLHVDYFKISSLLIRNAGDRSIVDRASLYLATLRGGRFPVLENIQI